MIEDINFSDNITQLKVAVARATEELDELEKRAEQYNLKTQEARQVLENLKQVLGGELPKASRKAAALHLRPLEVNQETGRPARGARRAQIESICRKLGQNKRQFRSVDVLNILREIEEDMSSGMKSYTYAVMTRLEAEGLILKVGRGMWRLA